MSYRIEIKPEYEVWRDEQPKKFRAQISKRIANIQDHEHFGHCKQLSDRLAEIKFNNGARIYFTVRKERDKTVVLLLGGNKNGQDKDIKKAESLLD